MLHLASKNVYQTIHWRNVGMAEHTCNCEHAWVHVAFSMRSLASPDSHNIRKKNLKAETQVTKKRWL